MIERCVWIECALVLVLLRKGRLARAPVESHALVHMYKQETRLTLAYGRVLYVTLVYMLHNRSVM